MNRYVYVKSDSDTNAKPKRILNVTDLPALKPSAADWKPDPIDTTKD